MLIAKVQKILVDNRWSHPRAEPSTMTQLAIRMGISYKHLSYLVNRGKPEDIARIAKGLGVDPSSLN